jgi:Eukaryotic glutathione synthase
MEDELLIDFRTAKFLKIKGYNEPVLYFYCSDGELYSYSHVYFRHNYEKSRYSAPTHTKTQTWLEEKHGIKVSTKQSENSENDWVAVVGFTDIDEENTWGGFADEDDAMDFALHEGLTNVMIKK